MEQQKYYQGEPGYYRRAKTAPWIWVAVSALLLVTVIGSFWLVGRSFSAPEKVYLNKPHIARVFVEGAIVGKFAGDYDHQFLLDTIDTLMDNDNNMALLVYVDSPGGEILASEELAAKIAAYREATGRPVYVYGHNMMASGSYWVACAGDRIVANRYCTTGSIGVTYGSLLDFSGFLERYGIRVHTITSGDQKAMGSAFEEMTPETEAIFQAIIDEYYGYFLDWVSANRPISREELIPLADGRIYTAAQAEKLRLIDQIGTYQDTLNALAEELGGVYPVEDYVSTAKVSFWDQFNWLDYFLYAGERQEEVLRLLPPTGPLAYYAGE